MAFMPGATTLQGASSSPGATPTSPQADVRDLDGEDLLAEAEVYWTYGHWRNAMDLYYWWIPTHTAPDRTTGRAGSFSTVASMPQRWMLLWKCWTISGINAVQPRSCRRWR